MESPGSETEHVQVCSVRSLKQINVLIPDFPEYQFLHVVNLSRRKCVKSVCIML